MGKRSDKNERLVNAAAELFWTRGFAATSLADIANASSVPLGNVYYYFKTKSEIAAAVAELFVRQLQIALTAIDSDYAEPAERIGAFFNLISASNNARATRGCPIARAMSDLSAVNDDVATKTGEPLIVMTEWLAVQARVAGLSDPVIRAERAIAEWQGAILLARAHGVPSRLDEAVKRIRRQFIAGY